MENYIKGIIIQLRDSGKSFQEISDILAKDYNVYKSRQAIHGIYQRAVKKLSTTQASEEIEAYDILQYISLGLSSQVISDITNITDYKIKQIRNTHDKQLEDIKNKQQEKAFELFRLGENLETVMNKLNYKGQRPTKQLVKQLMSKYIDRQIEQSKINILATIMVLYPDLSTREIIKTKTSSKQQYKEIYKQSEKKKHERYAT